MRDPAERKPGRPIHPVDLLVLAAAAALGCVAYAYLFRRSPVPRPVDPLLGKVVEVEFPADRPWKRDFPVVGAPVMIEDYLVSEALEAGPVAGGSEGHRRALLRILDRDSQRPETMTLFRTGIYRGTKVRLTSDRQEVVGEVVDVREPGGPR